MWFRAGPLLKFARSGADDTFMNADANNTIRLSESETELLTRALAEAAAQAAVGTEATGETQFVKPTDTEVQRKAGNSSQYTNPNPGSGTMIL